MNSDRRKELKAEIVPRWEEILQRITTPAKKRGEYVCPMCSHGLHGDGLKINPKSRSYGLKCFGGCGFSGNILDLLREAEGLDNFEDQIERACYYLGIDTEDRQPIYKKPAQNKDKTERRTNTDMNIHTNTYTDTQPPKVDYSPYYKESTQRLELTDYLSSRGISTETAKKFWIGYDPECKPYGSKSSKVWKALIIPTGRASYVARNTDPQATAKERYGNIGEALVFNSKALETATAPIVITEGEIDALSIIEVGGEVVGLGSTSNYTLLVKIIEGGVRPTQPLVLALDNDETGRTTSEKLAKELDRFKIAHYTFNLYGGHKDANEALQRDREGLSREVSQLADRIANIEEEKLRSEREEYYNKETAYGNLNAFLDGIEASVNTPATPTGYELLDRSLDGGLYEGLYIVGAITSLGKTTLVLQIADQIARSGKDVLIFSLEMARAELMSKSISRLTLIDVLDRGLDTRLAKTARGITDGARAEHYSEEEKEIMIRAVHSYRDNYSKHIFISEGIGDIGAEEIREKVAKHKRLTGEAPIVIIDYLQILAPYEVRASDKQNTDKAVLELKRLSRDFKTPVIGISSLNRAGYKEAISYESFKESGAIEYGSDVLIGLQLAGVGGKDFDPVEAKARDPREVELVILKNRNGKTGDKIQFRYYPMFNYFEEDIDSNTIQPPKSRKKS